ncbi:MAG: hypothetical protein WD036_09860 [Bauldia sp.]
MKPIWYAAIIVGSLAGPANATDLASSAAPSLVPASFDLVWSGLYAGLHGGRAWGNSSLGVTATGGGWPELGPGESYGTFDMDGFLAGAFGGYNYQMGRLLVGVEASANYAGFGYSGVLADDVFEVNVNFVATVTGRIGVVADNWLFYAKAGYAGAGVSASLVDASAPSAGSWSGNGWAHGYTVGGGVDVLLGRHILGVEYGYFSLGAADMSALDSNSVAQVFNVDARFHAVLGRIGTRF